MDQGHTRAPKQQQTKVSYLPTYEALNQPVFDFSLTDTHSQPQRSQQGKTNSSNYK